MRERNHHWPVRSKADGSDAWIWREMIMVFFMENSKLIQQTKKFTHTAKVHNTFDMQVPASYY